MTPETEAIIDRALAEDLQGGDVTTRSLIPDGLMGRARFVAEEGGVLSGLEVALAVFRRVNPDVETHADLPEGAGLEPGIAIGSVAGQLSAILSAERTALNFVRRLSGIATETSKYVREIAGYEARILDTRKTTPGLRTLEKQAVVAGGGVNHRRNLGDGVLIKDNHIDALRAQGATLADVVQKARANAPHTLKIEVEVEDLAQVEEALEAGADILLFDNMAISEMATAVRLAKGKALTEASGRMSLENVREVAATGVDLISVGALTHSSRALDIGLELTG
ncbi:MAG: carboxylating nicotinate-nucleotide diphosphorylase [Chloroflexi bacterium]|nr:carboxylating nicotinate-nucleotide diphosphorylase [Chloroflexota bacterium]